MHFRKTRKSHSLRALCGTSTRVAAGALGFRVGYDNNPEETSPHYGRACEAVRLDVPTDGGGSRDDSQIASDNHRGDDAAATEPFGPLETAPENISIVHARHEVSLRHPTEYFPALTHLQEAAPVNNKAGDRLSADYGVCPWP